MRNMLESFQNIFREKFKSRHISYEKDISHILKYSS